MVATMNEAAKGKEATDVAVAASVVDVAAPAGQAVTCSARGDGVEYSAGAKPDARIRSGFFCGTFDRHRVHRGYHGVSSIRGRASLSSISTPSSAGQAADAPFNLLPLDSEHFIQWDPPPPQDTSSGEGSQFGEEEGATLVVLLGWLGGRQKHLRRYAELYRDRGFGSLRFVVPVRKLVGLHFGRRVERMVAEFSTMIAAWCDADSGRTLLFHTFSHTGWSIYGLVLENLQSRDAVIERIRGCIVDSAPVVEITPEVCAAAFSAAILKKSSYSTRSSADSPDGSTLSGTLNKVNSVSMLTRPSWGETFLTSTLRKIFGIVLHAPDVNRRLRKVQALLSEKQPSCPQFYMYSSADRLVAAEYVETFISMQRSLGLSVFAHNFVSSPHVDHYRSFPHLYSAKVDVFLNFCIPARALGRPECETGATGE